MGESRHFRLKYIRNQGMLLIKDLISCSYFECKLHFPHNWQVNPSTSAEKEPPWELCLLMSPSPENLQLPFLFMGMSDEMLAFAKEAGREDCKTDGYVFAKKQIIFAPLLDVSSYAPPFFEEKHCFLLNV